MTEDEIRSNNHYVPLEFRENDPYVYLHGKPIALNWWYHATMEEKMSFLVPAVKCIAKGIDKIVLEEIRKELDERD